MIDTQLQQLSSKYNPLLLEAFQNLLETNDEYEFQLYVKRWIGSIFGISNVLFYYVEG